MPAVDLVVPGDPATPTGGYLYDRRIVDGLAALGWSTRVHALDVSFPRPSAAASAAAAAAFAAIPSQRAVVVDGLALAGLTRELHAHARRLRLIALVHHPVADETGLAAALRADLRRDERDALAAVERIVVTSRWTARRLAADDVAPERIRVVEPGTERRAARADARRATPLRLLCVATLTARKGHALLLDALASLRDLDWRLHCVGSLTREPATAAAVEQRISQLGFGDRVALHGELPSESLEALYARADVFVLPSFLEGYGMALADAVAHGLPVVSTTAGAIPETVPSGAGVLVEPGDRVALTAALRNVIADDALRRSLAACAENARAALPTWTEAAAGFAAAIEDLAMTCVEP